MAIPLVVSISIRLCIYLYVTLVVLFHHISTYAYSPVLCQICHEVIFCIDTNHGSFLCEYSTNMQVFLSRQYLKLITFEFPGLLTKTLLRFLPTHFDHKNLEVLLLICQPILVHVSFLCLFW